MISTFLFNSNTFLLVLPALLLRLPALSETSKNNSNLLLGSNLKEDIRFSYMATQSIVLLLRDFSLNPPMFVVTWQA